MKSNRWRFYIKPYDQDGNLLADYIECTDDVLLESVGLIRQDLDNVDYNVGIYRNSSISMKLRNEDGKYSDVDVYNSIFRYRRQGSLVKITHEPQESSADCGVAILDDALLETTETTIFVGFISDDSGTMSIKDQTVSFTILGREAIMDTMKVPYADIGTGFTSAVILDLLSTNNTRLTDAGLSISAPNVSVGEDQILDNVTDMENKTLKSVLQELLLAGNAVLYLDGDTVKVKPRTATASVQATFYGQTSTLGRENILDLNNIKTGISRMFNLWVWSETSLSAEETTQSAKYGIRRKEIDVSYFTNSSKRQAILNALRTEFGTPKMELELVTPFTTASFALELLDRVVIDYPTVYFQDQENPIPICGIAVCGTAVTPRAQWAFTMDELTPFKILGRAIDMKAGTITFKLREI